MPLFRAIAIYWQMQRELALAKSWWMLYDGGKEAGYLKSQEPIGGLLGQMIEEAAEKVETNYMAPMDLEVRNPNFPPSDVPASSFT